MNKIDLVPLEDRQASLVSESALPAVAISAQDAASTAPLLAAIELALWREGRLAPAHAVEAPRA
jgi:50S ribosomal subunit-associated GTPase HflX